MTVERDHDFEAFQIWMRQLDHEDHLIVARVALSIFSQPGYVIGYILARHFGVPIASTVILWSNLIISIIIYASILAAFRVYIEIRLRIRALLQKHPDFPMRRLPNARPGLGLYAPVGIGLLMVVLWSSLLYVEAGQDVQRQWAAIVITCVLALAGIVFAIGVGASLGKEETSAEALPPLPSSN
jgi:hypothetical protein